MGTEMEYLSHDADGKSAPTQVSDIVQDAPEYNWEGQRGSILCGSFSFVLQLVLVGCCGSFLFGFNVSLLNTAIRVIASEFQFCGKHSGVASYISQMHRDGFTSAAVDFCNADVDACTAAGCSVIPGVSPSITCKGGYADLGCSSYTWYLALTQTAVMIGGAIGATTAGAIVKYGRRTLFIVTMIVFAVGVVCCTCAASFASLFFARLIVGYGVGLSSVASPTYISEMTPRFSRGKYGVLHQLAITIGIFIGILLGLPLLDPADQPFSWIPDAFTKFWWRFMLGLGIVPIIIAGYLLLVVYTFETPVCYVEHKRYKDAYQIIHRIYDGKHVKEEFDFCVDNVKHSEEQKRHGVRLSNAFASPKYRTVLLVGLALAGFQQFGGVNVFVTSSSELFTTAGLSKTMTSAMSIIMALLNVLMTFPTILLIERMGRKSLLFWGSLLQFIVVLPCAISYWTESDVANPSALTQYLAIIAVIGFMVFFAVAFGPIVWVYLFEIFPIEIKDAASSLCTAFNWISACIMVFVANLLPNNVSFTIFAVLQGVATAFVLLFMKETRGLPIGTSPYIVETKRPETVVV